jgi:hypothetical protein
VWIHELFNGVALLVAVGMAKYQRRSQEGHALLRLLRLDRKAKEAAKPPTDPIPR